MPVYDKVIGYIKHVKNGLQCRRSSEQRCKQLISDVYDMCEMPIQLWTTVLWVGVGAVYSDSKLCYVAGRRQ